MQYILKLAHYLDVTDPTGIAGKHREGCRSAINEFYLWEFYWEW